MMKYIISSLNPASRFLQIVFIKKVETKGEYYFQLPSWRPGRYELGNFAKNIRGLNVVNENGNNLSFEKVTKDKWKVSVESACEIIFKYEYYAAQPDAGACWVDIDVIYVNPIHCCIYEINSLNQKCEIELKIPVDFKVASSMNALANNIFQTEDYHELVDSPFIASNNLKHNFYTLNGINFNIWLYGECQPDWIKINKDFTAFTKVQLDMMQSFTCIDYHFLVILLPYRFYHGVEHLKNTVLALGPGLDLMKSDLYNDFLGVASHELFHSWNVKTLRPKDFHIYNYNSENYSKLGWVYEGITTYYGDLFLARSGFFNVENYFNELNARLNKHYDNVSNNNYSVEESSFDTWLDGYVAGVPNRKTSIYDEGSLIALLLDINLRKYSNNEKSLDSLYKSIYDLYKGEGYYLIDFKSFAGKFSNGKTDFIFDELIQKRTEYLSYLQEALAFVGCYISFQPSNNLLESKFGIRMQRDKVVAIYAGSPSLSLISIDDELISINNYKVENNINDLIQLNSSETELLFFSNRKLKLVKLISIDKTFYDNLSVKLIADASDDQKKNFYHWTGIEI